MKYFSSNEEKNKWKSNLFLGIAIIIAFFVIKNVSYIFGVLDGFFVAINPFIIGFVLAFILNIPYVKIDSIFKKVKLKFVAKNHKGLAILSLYLLIILIVYLILNLLIPEMIKGIQYFSENVDTYTRNFNNLIDDINDSFNLKIDIANILSPDKIIKYLQSIQISHILKYIQNAMTFSTAILNFALSFIVSIYFLIEKENIIRYFEKLLIVIIGEKKYSVAHKYLSNLNLYFHKFIFAQSVDGVILGVLATITLNILGVQYSFLLGPFLGIANIIPYFGAIIGTVIVALLILITGGFKLAIITLICLMVLQQIDGNIIQPRLIGGQLKLSPALIIISITIGGYYYGVFGIIVAIPLVALLKNIVDDFVLYRENKKDKERIDDL